MKSTVSRITKRKTARTIAKGKLSRLNRWELLPPAHQFESNRKMLKLVPEVLKIKSVLVPIDFSNRSKKALRHAIAFGEQFGAKLTLFNVVEPPIYPLDGEFMAAMPPTSYFKELSQKKLISLAKQRLPPTISCQVLVSSGQPFREIVEAAHKLSCDLIIITTHGYTGLKHVFMGSTAERIVRHAGCPVLVVR